MNILAIGAHFDDLELGCGGALARHVKKGDKVYGLIATDSEYGNKESGTFRSTNDALSEAKEAASIIGYELITENIPTFYLESNEEISGKLVRYIEEYKIDQIYTHWINDVHHDHRNLAASTLHVSKHVNRILMYRSNWYDSSTSFDGRFYIDISDTWNKKESAIRAYKSEMKRAGEQWVEYFKNDARNNGMKNGTEYAECFEMVKWIE